MCVCVSASPVAAYVSMEGAASIIGAVEMCRETRSGRRMLLTVAKIDAWCLCSQQSVAVHVESGFDVLKLIRNHSKVQECDENKLCTRPCLRYD